MPAPKAQNVAQALTVQLRAETRIQVLVSKYHCLRTTVHGKYVECGILYRIQKFEHSQPTVWPDTMSARWHEMRQPNVSCRSTETRLAAKTAACTFRVRCLDLGTPTFFVLWAFCSGFKRIRIRFGAWPTKLGGFLDKVQ